MKKSKLLLMAITFAVSSLSASLSIASSGKEEIESEDCQRHSASLEIEDITKENIFEGSNLLTVFTAFRACEHYRKSLPPHLGEITDFKKYDEYRKARSNTVHEIMIHKTPVDVVAFQDRVKYSLNNEQKEIYEKESLFALPGVQEHRDARWELFAMKYNYFLGKL